MKFKDISVDEYDLGLHSSFRGKGKTEIERLFHELMHGFAKRCSDYIYYTGETPFWYLERQMNTFLLPGLDEYADTLLVEHPISRRYDRRKRSWANEHNGYVDFWLVKDKLQFIIEFKYSKENLVSQKATALTLKTYSNGMVQLETARRHCNQYSYFSSGKGTVPLLLHIVALESSHRTLKKTWAEDVSFKPEQIACDLKNQISLNDTDKPELTGYWSIPWELMKKSWDNGVDTYENHKFYPAILFFGKVGDKIISRA